MLKKISILYVVTYVALIVFHSCGKPNKCKGVFTNANTKIATGLPNPIFGSIDTTFKTFDVDSITIQFEILGNVFDCVNNNKADLFINTAYAFSPAPDNITVEDSLVSFDCITLRDYNANFIKGSSLLNNFSIITNSPFNWDGKTSTVSELLNFYNSEFKSLFGATQVSHYARFIQAPTNSGDTVQLASTYIFKSGLILRDTSELFVIKH